MGLPAGDAAPVFGGREIAALPYRVAFYQF